MQADRSKQLGRIVAAGAAPRPWMPLQSLFAHVHTNEAWVEIDLADVPADVLEAGALESPVAP